MCARARMATPAADPPGCVAALAQTTGCDCSWASPKNKAPLQGLAKAGTKAQMGCPASGADRAGCLAASASAEACEAFCCHGLDGAGPPEVTSAPAGEVGRDGRSSLAGSHRSVLRGAPPRGKVTRDGLGDFMSA